MRGQQRSEFSTGYQPLVFLRVAQERRPKIEFFAQRPRLFPVGKRRLPIDLMQSREHPRRLKPHATHLNPVTRK